MRIKAKGTVKTKGPSGHFYSLLDGDEITVHPGDEEKAHQWVKNGWVKNLDTGEEHEPVRNRVSLQVKDSVQTQGGA